MEWFKKGNKKYILGIFVIAILLFLPMFLNPYYENGDTLYHVANLSSMVQVIQNNFSYNELFLLFAFYLIQMKVHYDQLLSNLLIVDD